MIKTITIEHSRRVNLQLVLKEGCTVLGSHFNLELAEEKINAHGHQLCMVHRRSNLETRYLRKDCPFFPAIFSRSEFTYRVAFFVFFLSVHDRQSVWRKTTEYTGKLISTSTIKSCGTRVCRLFRGQSWHCFSSPPDH